MYETLHLTWMEVKMTAKFIKKPSGCKDIFDVKIKFQIYYRYQKHGDKALWVLSKVWRCCNFIKVSDAKIKKAYEELDSQCRRFKMAKRIEGFAAAKEIYSPYSKRIFTRVVLVNYPGGFLCPYARWAISATIFCLNVYYTRTDCRSKEDCLCSPPCKDTGMIHPLH